jgi:hypothetical protein
MLLNSRGPMVLKTDTRRAAINRAKHVSEPKATPLRGTSLIAATLSPKTTKNARTRDNCTGCRLFFSQNA